MLTIKWKKFVRALQKGLGPYPFRKIFSILIAIFSIITFVFTISTISKFNSFADREINILSAYYKNPDLTAPDQRTFLTILFAVVTAVSIFTFVCSVAAIIVLFTGRSNAYSLLRTITWVSLLGVIAAFIILSISSNEFTIRDPLVPREVYTKSPEIGRITFEGASFELIWYALSLTLLSSITSGIVRKEHGELKKNYEGKEFDSFKEKNNL